MAMLCLKPWQVAHPPFGAQLSAAPALPARCCARSAPRHVHQYGLRYAADATQSASLGCSHCAVARCRGTTWASGTTGMESLCLQAVCPDLQKAHGVQRWLALTPWQRRAAQSQQWALRMSLILLRHQLACNASLLVDRKSIS